MRQPTLPPQGYEIPQRVRNWAELKRPGVDVEEETEAWVDWCHANNRKFYDFEAALRNWLRKAKSNHTPAPALPKEFLTLPYIGPQELPRCEVCHKLEIDCACGVELRRSG